MARSLTAGMIAEVTAAAIMPIAFVHGDFDSGSLYLWTGIGDISWNGQTWTGTGALLEIAPLSETANIQAVGLTFRLNGMPAALISIALTENYQDRPIYVYIGMMSAVGAIVSDPQLMWAGRMDVMALSDDGQTATIELTAENKLIDLDRPRERRYTDADQQLDYAGDLFFEFLPEQEDKEIKWGRT